MSADIIAKLPQLQNKSSKILNPADRVHLQDHNKPLALVELKLIRNGAFGAKPRKGGPSLASPVNRSSVR